MSDFTDHVIVPREDFNELQSAAFDNATIGERVATAAQSTLFLGSAAGAFVLASWGWAKAMDWREERKFQRAVKRDKVKETEYTK